MTVLLNASMATRNVANVPGRPETCTEYQLHDVRKGVIDYTEKKLVRFATAATDPTQKLTLCALVDDYRNGDVAIAWKSGRPVFVRVTKDT